MYFLNSQVIMIICRQGEVGMGLGKILKSEEGSAVVNALIASVITVIISYALMSLKSDHMQTVSKMNAPISAQIVKARVFSTILSDRAMLNTINCHDGTAANCPKPPKGSADLPNPKMFALYNDIGTGQLLIDSRYSNSGFDVAGEPCFDFNMVGGSDECPFRYELEFADPAPAKNPLDYRLKGKFFFRPKSKIFINTSNFDIEYSNSAANEEIKRIVDTCRAFDQGTIIGAELEAGRASCSTFVRQCAGGSVSMDTHGNPICKPIEFATPPTCNKFLGFDPNKGTAICL